MPHLPAGNGIKGRTKLWDVGHLGDIWEKLEFLRPVADVPPLAWPSSGAPGDT